MLNIACLQLNSQNEIDHNIKIISDYIHTICQQTVANQKIEMIFLPENAFLMLPPTTMNHDIPSFTEEDHPGILVMQTLAQEYEVWIVIGSVLLKTDTEKFSNTCLVINSLGQIVARYHKLHLFDVDLPSGHSYRESDRCESGRQAVLLETPLGQLGLTICYDLRFPMLYRILAKEGAEIMIVPAAFTYETGIAHWEPLLRARAIENGCFIIAPAQTGLHVGKRRTYGHSLVVNPWGTVIASLEEEPGILYASLNIKEVEEMRNRIPSLKSDKEFECIKLI